MSERLKTYTIHDIADIINERSTGTVVNTEAALAYLDIDDKVGKEVFGPLFEEVGIHVACVRPQDDGTVRLWFEEE